MQLGRRFSLVGLGVVACTVGYLLREVRSESGGVQLAQASAPVVSGLPLPSSDANIFVNLAQRIVPSVVNIQTLTTGAPPASRRGSGGGSDDLFRRFFEDFFKQHGGGRPQGEYGGPEQDGDEEEEAPVQRAPRSKKKGPARPLSLGTGFVIDASGLILTNNHVIAGADEIRIQFTEEQDEKPTPGEVVGRDPELDLALIKVKTKKALTPVPLGDSDALQVGEYVIAVGNPFGQGHSVTHGIISAKERKSPDFALANYLQTDAPINPGNSGGPLVNLKGEVIGINNAIDQRAQGIGFAIPISAVKKVLPQLKTKGAVARGYIGVLVGELSDEIATKAGLPADLKAPMVTQVYPGEPADEAGIKPYDAILELNGKKIRSASDLISAVTAVTVGEKAEIVVQRGKEKKAFQIRVAERPSSEKWASGPAKPKGSPKSTVVPPVPTGMQLETLTPEIAKELGLKDSKVKGVVVSELEYEGAAAQAGLSRGDVIVEVDRKATPDREAFFAVVRERKSYLLRVRRVDGQGRDLYSVFVLDLKDRE